MQQATYSITAIAEIQSVSRQKLLYLAIAAFVVVSRLILIPVNQAEFTDGYQMLQWSWHEPVRWHPLYPLLVKLPAAIMEPVIAGRLVSAFAGLLTLIPLAALTRRFYGDYASRAVCLLFATSPLIVWIQTRVLTESLFVLLALSAMYYFHSAISDTKRRNTPMFILFAGLATLTRPEGLVFVPLAAFAIVRIARQRDYRAVACCAAASAPFLLFAAWLAYYPIRNGYERVMINNLAHADLVPMLHRLIHYVEIYPYVAFYPVFFLALIGFAQRSTGARWLLSVLYIHLAWFIILAAHSAWSARFLVFPWTLLLITAGGAVEVLRKRLQPHMVHFTLICLASLSMLFSGAYLFLQAGTFGDLKEAALYVKQEAPAATIYSDEKIKTSYYLPAYIHVYSRQTTLSPGDVVILHSFYSNLAAEIAVLESKYQLEYLFQSSKKTVPLLPLGLLSKSGRTNSTHTVTERFFPQKFHSIALRIADVRTTAAAGAGH